MTLKFKLVIEVDGKNALEEELGSEAIASIASQLSDSPENSTVFAHFAKSASTEVRGQIAYKQNINEETLELLAQDTSIEVRRRVCEQSSFRDWATTELVLQFVASDIDCAKLVAYNIESYSNADLNELAAHLSTHPDPDVRMALAGNWSAPKKCLKKLLSDEDPSVRMTAARTLS